MTPRPINARRVSMATGAAGCLILVLTALLHGMAFPAISELANRSEAPALSANFFEPLWLFPIVTWLVIAALVALQLRNARENSPNPQARRTMTAIGLIPLSQALTLLAFVGPFVGAYALLLAAALIWISAAAMQRDSLFS